MYHSRITLAALAVATIALSAPAEAHPHRSAQFGPGPGFVDIAAIPAYPTNHEARGHRARLHLAVRERINHKPPPETPEVSRAIHEPRLAESGIIRSKKTGITTSIDPRYQAQFQALTDDLEAAGATIYYWGSWRPGRCSLGSQHPCRGAVDYCQDSRGHVSGARDCNLPKPAEFHALVVKHHLYDGSVWCNGDYGHVQAKDSGGCNVAAHGSWGDHYLASMTGTVRTVSAQRHHKRHRLAHRHHRIRYAYR
jgi:hypothetical protein